MYRHYDILRSPKGKSERKKEVTENQLFIQNNQAIENQLRIDNFRSIEELTQILKENGFTLSREALRKNLKRFDNKSIAQTKAHERTQELKRKREEWCEKYKDFDWNNVILQMKSFLDEEKKRRRWLNGKEHNLSSIRKNSIKVIFWGAIKKEQRSHRSCLLIIWTLIIT